MRWVMNVSNLKRKKRFSVTFVFHFIFFFNSFQQLLISHIENRFDSVVVWNFAKIQLVIVLNRPFCFAWFIYSIPLRCFFFYLLECSVHNFHKVEKLLMKRCRFFKSMKLAIKEHTKWLMADTKRKYLFPWITKTFGFSIHFHFRSFILSLSKWC